MPALRAIPSHHQDEEQPVVAKAVSRILSTASTTVFVVSYPMV